MDINIVYDSSVASAPAGYETAVQDAVALVEALFKSNITVNITFAWGALSDSGDIGQSNWYYNTYSYSSVISALKTNATGVAALANEVLPTTDPFGGTTMRVVNALAQQLGLTTSVSPASDNIVTLNSSDNYNFDPSLGAVSGDYTAVSVLFHEITEVLGRDLGSDGSLSPMPLGLFRYSSSGVIDTSSSAGGYLSLNGGDTNLVKLGNSGGDLGDFDIDYDSFGYGVEGADNYVSPTDLLAMEAIGYELTSGAHIGGGGTVTLNASDNDSAVLFNSAGAWDTVTGSNGSVLLLNDQASVLGGGDSVTFYAGPATATNMVSLYNTAGQWDTVTGSNGEAILNAAQASVVGGGDAIYLANSSTANVVSLYQTNGAWDTVSGSDGNVILNAAQASVLGGGDAIYLAGSSTANAVSLYDTDGAWDTVNGSDGNVILNVAQASVIGGGDAIYLTQSVVSLYATAGNADTVVGSNDGVILTNASANLQGGSDTLYFAAAFGQDTVAGFAASDTLRLAKADWTSFAALKASGDMTQVGGNTQIKLDSADVLTLTGVTASTLTSANFTFA